MYINCLIATLLEIKNLIKDKLVKYW